MTLAYEYTVLRNAVRAYLTALDAYYAPSGAHGGSQCAARREGQALERRYHEAQERLREALARSGTVYMGDDADG